MTAALFNVPVASSSIRLCGTSTSGRTPAMHLSGDHLPVSSCAQTQLISVSRHFASSARYPFVRSMTQACDRSCTNRQFSSPMDVRALGMVTDTAAATFMCVSLANSAAAGMGLYRHPQTAAAQFIVPASRSQHSAQHRIHESSAGLAVPAIPAKTASRRRSIAATDDMDFTCRQPERKDCDNPQRHGSHAPQNSVGLPPQRQYGATLPSDEERTVTLNCTIGAKPDGIRVVRRNP